MKIIDISRIYVEEKKAMYNLEYASLIISGSLSFICFYLSLLLNLNIGRVFKNNTGLIGVISGVISFILTLVYVCYSGYIFNNDIAYGIISLNSLNKNHSIKKLFPNGAIYKWNNNKYISSYEEDFGDYSNYIKYKELGDKRYNYMSELYKKFDSDDPCYISFNTKPSSYIYSCDYIFIEPYLNISNKYLYDRWLTTLVLSCFILAFDICLIIFGFLLFKDKKDEPEPVNVNTSQNIIQFSTKDKNKILNIIINNIAFNNANN